MALEISKLFGHQNTLNEQLSEPSKAIKWQTRGRKTDDIQLCRFDEDKIWVTDFSSASCERGATQSFNRTINLAFAVNDYRRNRSKTTPIALETSGGVLCCLDRSDSEPQANRLQCHSINIDLHSSLFVPGQSRTYFSGTTKGVRVEHIAVLICNIKGNRLNQTENNPKHTKS